MLPLLWTAIVLSPDVFVELSMHSRIEVQGDVWIV
jgi:hypothetical protein